MTGFGCSEKNGYRVEARSLNHRFLDIHIKAPVFLSQHEISFRNAVKSKFSRGKIDINISINETSHSNLAVSTDLAKKVISAYKGLQDEIGIPGEIDIKTLVSLHEIFLEATQEYDIDIVSDVLREALDSLYAMRIQEGEHIAAGLRKMAGSLGEMNERIRVLSQNNAPEIHEKIKARMKRILDEADFDENRILQEAALLASKLDITEEIARLSSHLAQFTEILDKGDIIGKKLDFVSQELNREVNTIASKTSDYAVSRLAVDMKTEIEKMREQVQNMQ